MRKDTIRNEEICLNIMVLCNSLDYKNLQEKALTFV